MISKEDAIISLRPGVEWTMSGGDVESIIWHTDGVEPLTEKEVGAEMERLAEMKAQEVADKEVARLSARARLNDMGFNDAEIDVMYPNLIAPIV